MFDFLSEPKRKIIINHRSLGRVLKSSNDIATFIGNLDAFKAELCSETERGANKEKDLIFREEEIERIERYAKSFYENLAEMKKLSKRILTEAGFEIFVEVQGDRPELCDTQSPSKGDRDRMVVYRLHGFYPARTKINTGIPLNLILKSDTSEKFQVEVEMPRGCNITPLENFETFMRIPFESNFYRRGYQGIYPNSIRCSLMCREIEYEQVQVHRGFRNKEIKVPHKVFGLLGFKNRKVVSEPYYSSHQSLKSAKPMPLNSIVETENNHPAYILELILQKVILDRVGRSGAYPFIFIFAAKQLIEEIGSFLLKNPELYVDLIREFLPQSLFPKVNKGILEAPSLPTKGVEFENYTTRQHITIS